MSNLAVKNLCQLVSAVKKSLFLFSGMPLAQAVAILQKHCRIIKNVQVLYSEQVSSAWAGQEMHLMVN